MKKRCLACNAKCLPNRLREVFCSPDCAVRSRDRQSAGAYHVASYILNQFENVVEKLSD
jgi:hypothetical protein